MGFIRTVCIITLLILLVGGENAGAASSIAINPTTTGGDFYIVSASGLVDAALIDFTFSYDTATIVNPKVVPGQLAAASNATMEAITTTEGEVRVVFITDSVFKGAGQLATISFTRVGKLPGRVFDLNADVFSSNSEQVAAEPVIGTAKPSVARPSADQAAADLASQQAAANRKAAADANAAASGRDMSNIFDDPARQSQQQQSGAYQETITASGNSPLPQEPRREEPKREEPRRQERMSTVSQEAAHVAAPTGSDSERDDGEKSSTPKSSIEALALLKGVEMPVQRFRVFKGERTVTGLVPLFDAGAAYKAGVVQVPDIAVSDGKNLVTVKIELAASGMVPNFSLRGANLKSIRPITDKAWELDALPQKGKSDVHLTVMLGKDVVDIPLVVIPPMDAAAIKETQEFAEAGVNALLAKGKSNPGKIVYDLNSDGRQDYLDDYILIAHYLLKNPKADNPAKKIN